MSQIHRKNRRIQQNQKSLKFLKNQQTRKSLKFPKIQQIRMIQRILLNQKNLMFQMYQKIL
jgi:hypothetical protein